MPGLYTHTSRQTSVTETQYNADHNNHITNHIPEKMDDYSENATEMQQQTDPGESGSESLPTSLAGELERLRFAIAEMKGTTYWYESSTLQARFVANSIGGLVVSISSGSGNLDISVSAGMCRNDDDDANVILTSALVKQLDADFAEGTNQGGMSTSISLPTSDTVHIFIATKDSDGTVDIIGDTSSTGANGVTGWTIERRIASLTTDGSALLTQVEVIEVAGGALEYLLDVAVQSHNGTGAGTSAVTVDTAVPDDFQMEWIGSYWMADASPSGTTHVYFSSPDTTDAAAAAGNAQVRRSGGDGSAQTTLRLRTDTSGNIRFRADATATDMTHNLVTYGWVDYRR